MRTKLPLALLIPAALLASDIRPGTPANSPTWQKYALVAIANGVNGCANANGCWQVNGVLGANKAAGLTQDITLFRLPVKGKVTDWRIKTAIVFTGTATALTGLGTTGNDVLFRAATYDLTVAVSNTNLTEGPTAGAGSGTAADTNIVASLITTVNNIELIAAGSELDIWVQWSVLP
jgi:hypothetical protein